MLNAIKIKKTHAANVESYYIKNQTICFCIVFLRLVYTKFFWIVYF